MNDRYAEINKEFVMIEKPEWEVIDDGPQSNTQPNSRPTAPELLRAMLGPYWRWKIAGFLILAATILTILAVFVGAIVLVLFATAVVLFVTTKIRRWLQPSSGTHLPKNPEH